MARKPGYILMIDTETCNTITEGDRLNMNHVLMYDLGLSLLKWSDLSEVLHRSFVIDDIFNGEQELMKTAYYAKKLPQYHEQLASGERELVSAFEAKMFVKKLCQEYNIIAIVAHNARFDVRALNNLDRWTTKSRFRYFLPYGMEVWDTLKMSRQVIGKMPTYKKFCAENGYLTKRNQCRFTAEILYRFISRDESFKEAHTALEDVKIETEILRYIKRQHKAVDKVLYAGK